MRKFPIRLVARQFVAVSVSVSNASDYRRRHTILSLGQKIFFRGLKEKFS
jgi:uncharacterized protein YfbU (UPF0304 family)